MAALRRTAPTVLPFVAVLAAAPAAAQSRTLEGRISTGRYDAPWGGALIRAEGVDQAVCAAPDGSFRIDLPSADLALTVEPIGYTPRSLRLGPSTRRLFLNLETDAAVLDEIIVTVRREGAPAGRSERIEGEDIVRVPNATLEQGLQGKLAGVDIASNSGAPGGGMQTTLRGIHTVLGNTSPLFVLDGVVISNASLPSGRHVLLSPSTRASVAASQDDVPNRISDLNPNDVASVEVLKGAAATAMYGSKGSNGVVLITTKRGVPASSPPASSAFDCLLPPG